MNQIENGSSPTAPPPISTLKAEETLPRGSGLPVATILSLAKQIQGASDLESIHSMATEIEQKANGILDKMLPSRQEKAVATA